MMADWNYYESENYLWLFWASRYDFLRGFLLKLMNKPYRPGIMNEVYYWRKGSK